MNELRGWDHSNTVRLLRAASCSRPTVKSQIIDTRLRGNRNKGGPPTHLIARNLEGIGKSFEKAVTRATGWKLWRRLACELPRVTSNRELSEMDKLSDG